jgi:lysophospholipase L1-like esterase
MSDDTIKRHNDIVTNIFSEFPSLLGLNHPPSTELIHPKKIFLVGDSLIELSNDPLNTFPLGSALAHLFRRRADVLNRGLSGYSSKWMDSQFHRIKIELAELGSDQVFMVVILMGTNDSVLPGNPHHVPIEDFKNNLRDLVRDISTLAPSAVIIVVSPPPCSQKLLNDKNSKLSKSGRERSNEAVESYVAAAQDIVSTINLPLVTFVNLYDALTKTALPIEKYLTDGVHLSGEGYKVLFINLIEVLRSLSNRLMTLPMIEPHFSSKIN